MLPIHSPPPPPPPTHTHTSYVHAHWSEHTHRSWLYSYRSNVHKYSHKLHHHIRHRAIPTTVDWAIAWTCVVVMVMGNCSWLINYTFLSNFNSIGIEIFCWSNCNCSWLHTCNLYIITQLHTIIFLLHCLPNAYYCESLLDFWRLNLLITLPLQA